MPPGHSQISKNRETFLRKELDKVEKELHFIMFIEKNYPEIYFRNEEYFKGKEKDLPESKRILERELYR